MLFSLLHAASVGLAIDPRHAPLTAWLERCGASVGPVKMGKSSLGAGYGAFVTADVEAGTELFTVPSRACELR